MSAHESLRRAKIALFDDWPIQNSLSLLASCACGKSYFVADESNAISCIILQSHSFTTPSVFSLSVALSSPVQMITSGAIITSAVETWNFNRRFHTNGSVPRKRVTPFGCHVSLFRGNAVCKKTMSGTIHEERGFTIEY
jgi:hypothetical protein